MLSTANTSISEIADVIRDMAGQVFSTMLGMELEGGIVETSDAPMLPEDGIVAMVGIAGAISGNVCLRISNRLSCTLAGQLLMSEYSEVNDEVLDAIAEIANMIVGGLKTNLEDRFGTMGLSLPTVISAERYITRNPTLGERFTITFQCPHENSREGFSVQMCLIREREDNSYLKELAELHRKLN